MQPSARTFSALAVALLAGAIHGLRVNAALLFLNAGSPPAVVGWVVVGLGVVGLIVDPLAVAVAGYLWGVRADVPRRGVRFAGATFVVALAGFGLTYVPVLGQLLVAGGIRGGSGLPAKVVGDAAAAIGLANVALAGLAGAAVAHFRADETRNSNTAVA